MKVKNDHRTGIAEVTGSNPVEALIFSGFFFPIAKIGKFNCDDHSSLPRLYVVIMCTLFKVVIRMITVFI